MNPYDSEDKCPLQKALFKVFPPLFCLYYAVFISVTKSYAPSEQSSYVSILCCITFGPSTSDVLAGIE